MIVLFLCVPLLSCIPVLSFVYIIHSSHRKGLKRTKDPNSSTNVEKYYFLLKLLHRFETWPWINFFQITFPEDSSLKQVEQSLIERRQNKNEPIWSNIRFENVEKVRQLIMDERTIMMKRGPVGELPIHLCFLFNTEKTIQIAFEMIKIERTLLKEQYAGMEYTGENVLHIAIIKKRADIVKKLVAMEPKLLEARATGNFFTYKKGKKDKRDCYYGEFPLAFAIATNQFDIFDILVKAGANLDVVDGNGNNILHVLVIRKLIKAFDHFEKTWKVMNGWTPDGISMSKKIVPWKMKNNDGFTPFTLSAELGLKEMFHHLLEKRRQVEWNYGPVTCILLPLDELDDKHWQNQNSQIEDSTVVDNKVAKDYCDVLTLIVNGGHVDLLNNDRIIDLVEKKWNKFGKRCLFCRFVFVSCYLMVFTFFIIKRQSMFEDIPWPQGNLCAIGEYSKPIGIHNPNRWDYAQFYLAFIIVVIGATYKGWRELLEVMAQGIKAYFSASGSAFLENTVSITYFFLIAVFTASHFLELSFERLFLGMASFIGYSYLFFFLLSLKLTGPMIIMVYDMLHKDVLRFLVVYSVFLFGFSQAFYVLNDSRGASGLLDSVRMCFEATFGEFNFEESHGDAESNYRLLSVFLLVGYIVVVSICLFNLLIAMMGDTYTKVSANAENKWRLERARVIISIENEMTMTDRKHPRNKYFVEIENVRFIHVYDNDEKHFVELATTEDSNTEDKKA